MDAHTVEPEDPKARTDPETYTIEEFCEAHNFSRSMYFNLKKAGLGPREMRIGKRRIVTREAAADWRRARESEAA